MSLVALKNRIISGKWFKKRQADNHPLTDLDIVTKAIEGPIAPPPSSRRNGLQGPPSEDLNTTSSAPIAENRPAVAIKSLYNDADIITAVSSPATLVPKPSALCGNRKDSMISDGSSLNLDFSSQGQELHRDLEAQQPAAENKWSKSKDRMISDATLGLADGMTVPFALTAGLSTFGDARIVYLGGLAELFAGAVSMGLGGYVAAKGEEVKLKATRALVADPNGNASALVLEGLKPYGLSSSVVRNIVSTLLRDPVKLSEFLMRFHFEAKRPDSTRPAISAATIGLSYLLGGLIPLIPYFCVKRTKVLLALYWSIGIMASALFAFGWTKTAITDGWKGKANCWANAKAAIQMVLIGAVAAGVAVGLIRAVNHGSSF